MFRIGRDGVPLPTGEVAAEIKEHGDLMRQRKESREGIALGLKSVDDLVSGLQPGELMVVGTSQFTAECLLAHVTLEAAKSGRLVCYGFAGNWLEPTEVMLAQVAGVSVECVLNCKYGNPAISNLEEARVLLHELDIRVTQLGGDRSWYARKPISVDEAVVREYRLLRRRDSSARLRDRLEIVSCFEDWQEANGDEGFYATTSALKRYAATAECPVILGANLVTATGEWPLWTDVRESGIAPEMTAAETFWAFAEQNIDVLIAGEASW